MAEDYPIPKIPTRPMDGHKGTFGSVLVIGGSDATESSGVVMLGAPALVARAALRSGCGLVKIAAADSIIQAILTIEPSATGLALPRKKSGHLRASGCAAIIDEAKLRVSVLAIGPGFGVGFEQQQIIIRLLADETLPVVLDADALNNLALIREFTADFQAPAILTPHPGEFARLAEVLGISYSIQSTDEGGRATAAAEMAQRLGCIVVLKGAGTVVSDGQRVWRCGIAEAALATAGSGDVLTGIVASLVAQYWEPALLDSVNDEDSEGLDLFACAVLGVELHGRSALAWCDEHGGVKGGAHGGMRADELADLIPRVFAGMGG